MFADLRTAGILSEFDSSRGGEAYVWGCRLNHPNPLVVHGYLEAEEHQLADGFYSRLGILMAIVFHLRLNPASLLDQTSIPR